MRRARRSIGGRVERTKRAPDPPPLQAWIRGPLPPAIPAGWRPTREGARTPEAARPLASTRGGARILATPAGRLRDQPPILPAFFSFFFFCFSLVESFGLFWFLSLSMPLATGASLAAKVTPSCPPLRAFAPSRLRAFAFSPLTAEVAWEPVPTTPATAASGPDGARRRPGW